MKVEEDSYAGHTHRFDVRYYVIEDEWMQRVIAKLLAKSCWFAVTPIPDGDWTIEVKAAELSTLEAAMNEAAEEGA